MRTEGKNGPVDEDEKKQQRRKNVSQQKQQQKPFYFCDQPHAEYAHVVLASVNESVNLWNVDAIRSMCRMDELLRSSQDFPSVCQTVGNTAGKCCPSWSLGHYIALMTNRSGGCNEIDEHDVQLALDVLSSCAKHYHGLQLSANCDAIVQEGKQSFIVPSLAFTAEMLFFNDLS